MHRRPLLFLPRNSGKIGLDWSKKYLPPCGGINPLLCPKCLGIMRIISFIEEEQLVKKILKHLRLWDIKRKPAPRANGPPTEAFIIYDESSSPSADDYLIPLEAGLSDWNLSLEKPSRRQTGELCSNWPKISTPAQIINIDNKTHLGYPDDYRLC